MKSKLKCHLAFGSEGCLDDTKFSKVQMCRAASDFRDSSRTSAPGGGGIRTNIPRHNIPSTCFTSQLETYFIA